MTLRRGPGIVSVGQIRATAFREATTIEAPGTKHPADAFFLTGRWWNIGLRTGHLAAMGVLVGGHAFDVPPERLAVALAATLLSGVALAMSEAGPHLLWFHQLRGLMTLAKLVLLGTIPLGLGLSVPDPVGRGRARVGRVAHARAVSLLLRPAARGRPRRLRPWRGGG